MRPADQRRMAMSRRLLNNHPIKVVPPAVPVEGTPRPLADREHQDLLEHVVARDAQALRDAAIDYVIAKDREIEAQILDLDQDMQDLIDLRLDLVKQRVWLAQQREQLIDEAAAERKGR
jgi:hypothetical protein